LWSLFLVFNVLFFVELKVSIAVVSEKISSDSVIGIAYILTRIFDKKNNANKNTL